MGGRTGDHERGALIVVAMSALPAHRAASCDAWNQILLDLAAADRAYEDAARARDEGAIKAALDRKGTVLNELWSTTPPDLVALAKKLELAAEWLMEPAPPVNAALQDLRTLARRH